MKRIPKHLNEPVSATNRHGIDIARACIEIEASLYNDMGRAELADALRYVARSLKKITKNTATPAQAFYWAD